MPFRPSRAPVAPGGTMPLVEHLRELRYRLVLGSAAIAVGVVVGWFLFDPIYHLLSQPYIDGVRPLIEKHGLKADLTVNGVAGAFTFKLKVALVTGIVISSPIWFWQIWAFILPALHRHEKRWVFLLSGTGAPLFMAGVALGYFLLPKGIGVLIGFTPHSVTALLSLGDYLNFVVRTLLVFGLSAEIPLVVVLLNRLHIVSGAQLRKARPFTIVGIFIFAAIATPSTDPLSMLFLAVPMVVLYGISEIIAHLTDRRRGKTSAPSTDQWNDDETSPLEVERDPEDDRPSTL